MSASIEIVNDDLDLLAPQVAGPSFDELTEQHIQAVMAAIPSEHRQPVASLAEAYAQYDHFMQMQAREYIAAQTHVSDQPPAYMYVRQ